MEEKKEFKPNCANCMAKAKIYDIPDGPRYHFECRRNVPVAMLQPSKVMGQGGFNATYQVVSAWPVINEGDPNSYCLQWMPDREAQKEMQERDMKIKRDIEESLLRNPPAVNALQNPARNF